jgi:glyoxylase-like metal-dependent hydrolase (beta-lactamase superfamily II)
MSWKAELLAQGYPGVSLHNGTLGWSSVLLAHGPDGRIALVDTGAFGLRRVLRERLAARGLRAEDVTDILLSHLHYDHCDNWTLFPRARVHVPAGELAWALGLPEQDPLVPLPVVQALAASGRVAAFAEGAEPLPGIRAVPTPGHSPHHTAFLIDAVPQPVIFAADAAKNLAELASGEAAMTMDAAASRDSIRRLRALWDAVPAALFLPGHDLPLRRGADARPERIGARAAGIRAILGEDPADSRIFALDS